MAGKITLPRRRFFHIKGGKIELAVGLLLSTILESGAALASESKGVAPDLNNDANPAAVPANAAELLAAIGGDVDAIKTLSVEELKAILTPEMLAQLGLNADFLEKLDADLNAAIRDLEAAFRKKIAAAAAASGSHIDGDAAHHQDAQAGEGGAEAAAGEASGGGISPLLIIGGLAVVGGGIALAASGGDDEPAAPANFAPTATNDSFTVNEDTAITFDVRTNDTDANGDALTVTQINGTAISASSPVTVTGGVVSLGADGRLTFTPTANYNGSPSFTYTVSDGKGGTATGTVNGTVTAVNDAPVATNDTFTMAEDGTPAVINVRANDTDVDGDTLTVTAVNGTAMTANGVAVTGGIVTLVNGNLVFTPAANYNGSPSFTYTVSDGKGGTATATVTGTVTPVADAPVNTIPVPQTVIGGQAVLVSGLSISDGDGPAGTYTTTLTVSNGTLSIATVAGGATITGSGTGTVTISGTLAQVNASLGLTSYTSGAGFSGAATLTMTTSDGALTDTDTLNLTVGGVQTGIVQDGYISGAQVFYDANGNGAFDQGEPFGTTNAQGQYSIALPPGATGSIVALGGTNVDTGLPNLMPLKAPVGSSVVNPLTTLVATLVESGVSVAAANAAVAASLGLPAGTDFTNLDFLAPGQDPEVALAVQKAAVQVAQIVTDAIEAGVNPATLIAAISSSAAAGQTVDLTNSTALGDLLVSIGVSASLAESIAVASAAVNQAVAAATDPSQVSQVQGELNQPGANLPAVANADTILATEDGEPVSVNVLSNDFDPEGGSLTLLRIGNVAVEPGSVVTVTGGTITVGENGLLTFTPAPNFNGTPTFTYTVVDAGGREQVGTVGITVTPVNDAPTTTTPALDVLAPLVFGSPVAILNPLADASDVDGDTLTITAINGIGIEPGGFVLLPNGAVLLNADGTLSVISPIAGPGTELPFTYTVSDGNGGSFTASINVTLVATSSTVTITADQLDAFLVNAQVFANAGVDSIDIVGDDVTISPAQAATLLTTGIAFVDGDEVTFEIESSRPSLTLKDMQQLNVDSVAVGRVVSGEVVIQAGVAAGALGDLASDALPVFNVAQTDAALDLTLSIGSGTIASELDLSSLATSLRDAGVDHLAVVDNGSVSLSLDQAVGLQTAGIDFNTASDVSLNVTAADVSSIALNPGVIGAINVDHLDVIGDSVTITDVEASALLGAGVDFAEADDVTLSVEGTQTSVTLKGMQDLHIDSVSVGRAVSVLSVDAGAALSAIDADALPSFVADQTDASLDVTLNVEAGTLPTNFDLASLATALDAAGVDHLGVNGGGISLDVSQATALATAGIDFVEAADVTLSVSAVDVASIAANSALLTAVNVDHLDVIGDAITITENQASALIGAGVDFVDGDDVTLATEGTQSSVTLKGMQDLHVDSVSVGRGVTTLTLDAGATLQDLSTDDLPSFTIEQTDAALDVTLNIESGTLPSSFDAGSIASALASAGIDHLSSDSIALNFDHVSDFAASGLDFTAASDVTVDFADTELPSIIANAGLLAAVNVDHLHAIDGTVTLSDADASALVNAGVDFAVDDNVTVEAGGTQMSTSLKGLQALHVDSVAVAAGVTELHLDAGDLSTITAGDLPQFDVAQDDASLDVTLFVDTDQLSEVERLAEALRAAGVDHFAVAQPIDSYDQATQDLMSQIAQSSGIDFLYDPDGGSVSSFALTATEFSLTEPDGLSEQALLRELVSAFEQHEDQGVGGTFELTDGTVSALVESGTLRAFTADHLVIDGTASGDQLLTTLKDIADLGIDQIKVGDVAGPTYVNLGALDDPTSVSELKTLIESLTSDDTGPKSIFTGNEKIALVVEADVAHALSQIDQVFEKLAAVGFTEVDVLATDGSTALDINTSAIEVKLIGQDEDLYRHLHDDHR